MKATLAFLGSVTMMGAVLAAEVLGNNTAVVVRKTAVNSSSDYQFLCVPTAGLDITGVEDKTIPLEEILPPATMSGAEVTFSDVNLGTYKVIDEVWVKQGGELVARNAEVTSSTVEVAPGTTFWLQGVTADTVFCGQDSGKGIFVPEGQSDSLIYAGNASSGAISIQNDITPEKMGEHTFGPGSQLFVVEAGQADYKIYFYDQTGEDSYGWTQTVEGNIFRQPIGSDVTIAAGEAFYLYKVPTQQ